MFNIEEFINQQQQQRIESYKQADAWQRATGPGDYVGFYDPYAEAAIYGELQHDQETAAAYDLGERWGKWYSTLEPAGEWGFNHCIQFSRQYTKDQFERIKEIGWATNGLLYTVPKLMAAIQPIMEKHNIDLDSDKPQSVALRHQHGGDAIMPLMIDWQPDEALLAVRYVYQHGYRPADDPGFYLKKDKKLGEWVPVIMNTLVHQFVAVDRQTGSVDQKVMKEIAEYVEGFDNDGEYVPGFADTIAGRMYTINGVITELEF